MDNFSSENFFKAISNRFCSLKLFFPHYLKINVLLGMKITVFREEVWL